DRRVVVGFVSDMGAPPVSSGPALPTPSPRWLAGRTAIPPAASARDLEGVRQVVEHPRQPRVRDAEHVARLQVRPTGTERGGGLQDRQAGDRGVTLACGSRSAV